jgi:hypothetical protein
MSEFIVFILCSSSVFEAGFLQSRIDSVGGSRPDLGVRVDERCDFRLAQILAAIAQIAQDAFRVVNEIEAKLFVGN